MEKNQKKNPNPLRVSSLSEFKKIRQELMLGKLIELPQSKLVVKVARPSLEELIIKDKIPKTLIATAMKVQARDVGPDDIKQVIQLRDFVVLLAIKEPVTVIENPTNDEITLDSLPVSDRDFIYNYVEKGNDFLDRFSNPQGRK